MKWLTRDSIVLWLVIIGGGCGYLATLPAPWEWSWAQWMNALATLIMTIAAKLSNSMLKSKRELLEEPEP